MPKLVRVMFVRALETPKIIIFRIHKCCPFGNIFLVLITAITEQQLRKLGPLATSLFLEHTVYKKKSFKSLLLSKYSFFVCVSPDIDNILLIVKRHQESPTSRRTKSVFCHVIRNKL